MESKTQDFMANLDIHDIQENHIRAFGLFEEFSGKSIFETIRNCRDVFAASDVRTRRRLASEAETQVRSFSAWLEEVKGLHSDVAHYYSISLKSLLAGLPMGVEVGLLFGIAMDKAMSESDR